MSDAKEKQLDRLAKKKLQKKEKYSKAFIKSTSNNVVAASDNNKTKKKIKKTFLSDAYSRAGVAGSDLYNAGKRLFEQVLVNNSEAFFENIYEQQSLLISRNDSNFFSEWLHSKELRALLDSNKITSDDATVTRWNGTNRENKPFWKDSWETDFRNGWSIRLLRPQTELANLWRLCSLLEAYWGQSGGANIYWTPKSTQGFAPHYDDVDVFIMQIEGKKRWFVYEPADDASFPALPLESSLDFLKSDLARLNQVHDVVLDPGDMLYLPRGFIHYAESLPDDDSLHITISMGSNKMTWSNLLEKAMLRAISIAKLSSTEMRASLPRGFESYMGAQFVDQKNDIRRSALELQALELFRSTIVPALDVDAACDDLVGEFMHDRHRPALENENGDDDDEENVDVEKLRLKSVVELKVLGAARICVENGLAVVRHCMKNSRLYHEVDERGLEFDLDDAPTIEAILNSKNGPFSISNLPEVLVAEGEEPEEDGGRIRIVSMLLSENILRLVQY